MELAISDEQLAMHYQLAINDDAALNGQLLMANAWPIANGKWLMEGAL
jgi:hypothetical protein